MPKIKRTAVLEPKSLRVGWPVPHDLVPMSCVPGEQEDAEVEWQLKLGPLTVFATFSGRTYRRMAKAVATQAPNVSVVLQGRMVAAADGRLVILDPGFTVNPKPAKEPAPPQPAASPPTTAANPAPTAPPSQPLPKARRRILAPPARVFRRKP